MASGVEFGEEGGEIFFDDRGEALVEGIDLGGLGIDADQVVSVFCEACHSDAADVTEAKDANFQEEKG